MGFATAAANQARFAATDLAPEHRVGRAFAWVAWAATIGAIIGPNLIDPAGSVALRWGLPQLSGAYVMCSGALLMGCLVLTTFLRPDPYLTSVGRGGSVRGGPPSIADGYRQLRRRPRAMLGIGVIVAGHVVMVMVMVMTPVYMKHVDVSLSVIGLVISAHVAGMYALSPFVGWAVDRLGPFVMVGVGIAVLISACITCSVTPANHDLTLGAGLFLLGVGWSCTLIAGSAMLTEAIDPRHRPDVQGLSDLAMYAAGAIGGNHRGGPVLLGPGAPGAGAAGPSVRRPCHSGVSQAFERTFDIAFRSAGQWAPAHSPAQRQTRCQTCYLGCGQRDPQDPKPPGEASP